MQPHLLTAGLSSDNMQPVAPGHSFLFGHLLYLKTCSIRCQRTAMIPMSLAISIEPISKGFNNEHFNPHLAGMIEEVKTYAETLRVLAGNGQMFYLDLVTLRFIMDIIGKTLLFDSPLIPKPIKIKLMKLELLNWGPKKDTARSLTA
jgi:hypothetical protein